MAGHDLLQSKTKYFSKKDVAISKNADTDISSSKCIHKPVIQCFATQTSSRVLAQASEVVPHTPPQPAR